MPVAFDNVGSTFSSGATLSLSFTFTAGANTVLLVFTCGEGDRSCSAVAYGGAALTQLHDEAGGGGQIWGLTAPAAGANTLSATWVATGAMAVRAVAVTYTGVRASNPFGTAGGTAGAATNVAFSLSSSSTDLVAYFAKNQGDSMGLSPGTTRYSNSVSSSCKMFVGDTTGAATLSASASNGSVQSTKIMGVPLVFSATGSLFTLALTGCGR